MKRTERDLVNGPLFSSIVVYTIPIILTSVLQLLFNAADLVVVGRFRGSLAVGAVGATGALTNLIINLFIGLSVGAGVTVAHAIGSRQEKVIHHLVHTAMLVALIGGAILTVVGVTFCGTFLRLMDTPENILALSTTYMRIYFGGITFTIVYNFAASILRAAGDTRSPLLFLSISGALNVLLNLVFVLGFGMSVEGVALATVIAQALSAFLVVRTLMRRTDACRLDLRALRISVAQLSWIMRIGIPAGIQASLFAISNVIIQSSINAFGDAAVAGSAAAGNIDGFVYVILNAFGQTALNFTGQNVGANNYPRVKKVLVFCSLLVSVTGLAVSTGIYLAGKPLLGIYITDSPQAIAAGMTRLLYLCMPYFLCGIMEVTTGCLRGMGASLTSMLMCVGGVCGFRLFWIYTVFRLPAFHSMESLFLSYPISWVLTLIMQLAAFLLLYRRRAAQSLPATR